MRVRYIFLLSLANRAFPESGSASFSIEAPEYISSKEQVFPCPGTLPCVYA